MPQFELVNPRCRVVIQPERGGRILDFIDTQSGKNWVWRSLPHSAFSHPLPLNSGFDQNFYGGWEDVFPNDAATCFQGRHLADHGELWSQRWSPVESFDSGVQLRYFCKTVPIQVEKIIVIDEVEPRFTIEYQFKNLSNQDIPYHFKLHPALVVEPGDEILFPQCSIQPVALDFSTLIGRNDSTPFPLGTNREGLPVLLNRVLQPEARQQEFFYASNLSDGWCGLRNERTGTQLKIRFDKSLMPYAWSFMSYGKWKDTFLVILEPSTNIPYDLETAYKNGTSAVLKPYATDQYQVIIELSSGA